MNRFLTGQPGLSSRYSLAITKPHTTDAPRPQFVGATEFALTSEQTQTLASYTHPVSRIHCCRPAVPVAPSDETQFVW